jgi:integrase
MVCVNGTLVIKWRDANWHLRQQRTKYRTRLEARRAAEEIQQKDTAPSRCPRCNFALWAKPIPRHVRFHDLRHTTATLLLNEGVPLATVQRILRHSDPELTAETYGHLDLEDMRRGLDRLTFELDLTRESGGLGAPVLHSPAT